jgi:hypothetical protein
MTHRERAIVEAELARAIAEHAESGPLGPLSIQRPYSHPALIEAAISISAPRHLTGLPSSVGLSRCRGGTRWRRIPRSFQP